MEQPLWPGGISVNHVIVLRPVSQAVAQFLAHDREAVLTVHNQLYSQLGNHADRYKRNRDQDDPDFLFNYPHSLYVGPRWVTFRFSVNDSTAPGLLIVEAVACR